jgi:hypothetical protein
MKIAKHKTKEYHRAKSKAHYKKYKASYNKRNNEQKLKTRLMLNELKAATGCKFCSEKEPVALDFHHLRGKDRELSSMGGFNEQRIQKEIAKCVILCANCHRKVHAGLIEI